MILNDSFAKNGMPNMVTGISFFVWIRSPLQVNSLIFSITPNSNQQNLQCTFLSIETVCGERGTTEWFTEACTAARSRNRCSIISFPVYYFLKKQFKKKYLLACLNESSICLLISYQICQELAMRWLQDWNVQCTPQMSVPAIAMVLNLLRMLVTIFPASWGGVTPKFLALNLSNLRQSSSLTDLISINIVSQYNREYNLSLIVESNNNKPMQSTHTFGPTTNHWDIFKQIPREGRRQHLRNNVNLKQVDDIIEIPELKYPENAFIEVAGLKHHIHIFPKNKYAGVFLMMHGMDGHGGNSGNMAKYLNENTDLIVIALDFRNYGQSIFDEHGYVESCGQLIVDAEAIVDSIIVRYKPEKLFLGGVSMGGGVAFRMAINRPKLYAGIVLLAPALRGNYQNSPYLKKVGKFIGCLFPRWKFMEPAVGSGTRHSCFNEIKDQLTYKGKIIPGTIRSILTFMEQNERLLDKLTTPYLMLMGASDKIVDPFAAVDLDLLSKSTDKTTYIGEHMWHYIPLEPEFMTEILPLTAKWLCDRSK